MEIATLGLTVNNAEANAAIDATGAKLDALGARGERAAALQSAAVKRVAREYTQLTSGELSRASQWYDQTYNAAAKVAKGQDDVTKSTGHAIAGFGRLNYSLGSMISRLSGVSPAFARLGIVLGNLSVGGVWVAAALLGIAAMGGAWALMSGHFSEGAERARASVKKLTEEVKSAADAMGTLSLAAAKANLVAVTDEANGKGGLSGFFSGMHGKAIAASLKVGLGGGTRAQEQAAYNASLLADVKLGKDVLAQATANTQTKKIDAYASMISDGDKSQALRRKELEQLKKDTDEMATLKGKWDDASVKRRVEIGQEMKRANDALYPKEHTHKGKKPTFLDHIAYTMTDVPKFNYLQQMDTATKGIFKSSLSGVKGELLAGGGPLQGMIDRAKVLEALGPSKELDRVKAAIDKMGRSEIEELAKSNRSWKEKSELIALVLHQLGEIGDKKIADPAWMKNLDKVVSGMRSGADAANLFGGPRGAEWGNILNTGANAAENVGSAIAQGGTNPIADAQAALSVASLAKQIFSLGSQSHETRDRINAANQALRDTMSIESDIVNHNPLQAMLDQAKQAYDQMYASINATLPGLKNQTQRNIDLAQATDMYNQKLAVTQAQFALDSSNFDLSMKARKEAAMGLTFDAARDNLRIQQASEMFAISQKYGPDSQQAKDLALVQNTEMLRLVNQSLTQVANAPTGFFAENYASSFVTKQQWPTSGGSTSGSGGTTVTGPITINVPAGQDPVATAKAVVKAIRQIGSSTVGINGTVADAMELM